MLQVYSDRVVESISDLLRYIDGIFEFESLLGSKLIDKLNQVSDDLIWILHDFE